jgi:chromate transporter
MSLQIPVLNTINFPALALSIAAVIALFRFEVGMIATLLGSSVAGIVMHFAGWIGQC